jgi:hypothetical protein
VAGDQAPADAERQVGFMARTDLAGQCAALIWCFRDGLHQDGARRRRRRLLLPAAGEGGGEAEGEGGGTDGSRAHDPAVKNGIGR